MKMESLEIARIEYKSCLENYKKYKVLYEDYYYTPNSLISKRSIKLINNKMEHYYKVLETLVKIFGEDIRKD